MSFPLSHTIIRPKTHRILCFRATLLKELFEPTTTLLTPVTLRQKILIRDGTLDSFNINFSK